MTEIDIAVFSLSLIVTTIALVMAVSRSKKDARSEAVAGRSLGPVVLALGAGATANSGFVLTGAVGLGYTGGLVWCLLPLGWLIGDIIFWFAFANRVHSVSRSTDSVTLPELIGKGTRHSSRPLVAIVAITVVLLMAIYVSSQWLSAGKLGGVILQTQPDRLALAFAGVVITYTAIAGVRGAAYSDFVQGLCMLALVVGIGYITALAWPDFQKSTEKLPADFFSLRGSQSTEMVLLSLAGFAAAAVGFDLGQPQMVNRWMSAASETAIVRARWLYIGFVQVTWLSYTALGTFIRTVIHVSDPEQALVAFVHKYGFPGMMGLLLAGAVSTIASTASSSLAVCAEMLRSDVAARSQTRSTFLGRAALTTFVGVLSLLGLAWAGKTVFSMAITAVSLLGASLAAPVLFIVFGAKPTASAVSISVAAGLVMGIAWRQAGYSAQLNESAPGILLGCIVLVLDVATRRLFRLTNGSCT